MKILSVFIIGLLSMGLSAQTNNSVKITANPSALSKSVSLQAVSSKTILKTFHYDNNEVDRGIGIAGSAYTMGSFIELPAETLTDYVGKKIDFVRFGLDNISIIESCKIVFYEESLIESPVFEQIVSIDSLHKGWNLGELKVPYSIAANKTLFVGLVVETNAGGYTHTYDTDIANQPEYSGHITLNGAYYGTLLGKIGIDADMNLQALITDGEGSVYSDLAITGIHESSLGCHFSDAEVLKVTLCNKGEQVVTDTFALLLHVNSQTLTQQVNLANLQPNECIEIFMPAINMSELGTYEVLGTIDYPDAESENNTYRTNLLSGDAVISIELLTDAYPEDTKWKLFDANDRVLIESGELEAETLYTYNLCVLDSNCYRWVIYDSFGDGLTGEDSVGRFTVWYNDSLISESPVEGNFGYEYVAMGMGTGCLSNDIKLAQIQLPRFDLPGEKTISGIITNMGTETLHSFEVLYSVNEDTIGTTIFNNNAIAAGASLEFVHSKAYNFSDNGSYKIEVSVLNPNGLDDENQEDNKIQQTLTVNSNALPKKQLIEQFASSSSDACFTFNKNMDSHLADKEGAYTLIKYPMNIPDNGDPYYTTQVGERANMYKVNQIPAVYRNGQYNMTLSNDTFEYYTNQKTILQLTGKAYYTNSNVNVELTVKSIDELAAGMLAHVAIIEKTTEGNTSTNGETEFYNVLMQLLPSAGTPLNEFSNGSTQTVTSMFDMSETFVENMDDLQAVVFVQDNNTMEVLQSNVFDVEFIDKIIHRLKTL